MVTIVVDVTKLMLKMIRIYKKRNFGSRTNIFGSCGSKNWLLRLYLKIASDHLWQTIYRAQMCREKHETRQKYGVLVFLSVHLPKMVVPVPKVWFYVACTVSSIGNHLLPYQNHKKPIFRYRRLPRTPKSICTYQIMCPASDISNRQWLRPAVDQMAVNRAEVYYFGSKLGPPLLDLGPFRAGANVIGPKLWPMGY